MPIAAIGGIGAVAAILLRRPPAGAPSATVPATVPAMAPVTAPVADPETPGPGLAVSPMANLAKEAR